MKAIPMLFRRVTVSVFVTGFLGISACQCGGTPDPVDEEEGNDIDKDGIPNVTDDDIDGDGVFNAIDEDMDGDGEVNLVDDDIDGDGKKNEVDDKDFGIPGTPDKTGPWADPDNDGSPNKTDLDDDNDGIPDGVLNTNPDANENTDGDGYCFDDPELGYYVCNDGAPPGSGNPDSDGDGIPDSLDPDDDNDGIPDGDDLDDNGGTPENPPGGGDEKVCQTESFNPGSSRGQVLIVLDRSTSMNQAAEGFGDNKWTPMRQAIGSVVQNTQNIINYGLYTFPGYENDSCDSGHLFYDVSATSNGSIVQKLNDPNFDAEGNTPTAAALGRSISILSALNPQVGTRAILLATDGGPGCNLSLDYNTCQCMLTSTNGNVCVNNEAPYLCLDDTGAITATAQVAAAGFPVFVVGIPGSESFAGVLNRMAEAGGTARAGTDQYYKANSTSDISEALTDVVRRIGSCRFDLATTPATVNDITVSIGGQAVQRDVRHEEGYDLVDANSIELFGSACDAAAEGSVVVVEACAYADNHDEPTG